MSWSIEEHIGECRPFPAQVIVYKGETDERMAYVSGEVADRLKAENDKLRELVSVMAYCMQYERECDGCRLNGADGTITAPVGCDGLLDRIRELGIEED